MLLATKTPTPIVVTSTPTAQNSATAEVMALQETAIAATTGTPAMVTATSTGTPWIVTPTPVAEDVFIAATLASQATMDSDDNWHSHSNAKREIMATRTPTPIVVTNTPTAENIATENAMKMRETSVALTTGQPNMVTTTPTLTPFIVTATQLPVDVFVAATLVSHATVNATTTGTVTPTPKNMLLATKTPTPLVVTSTPTAQNEATRIFMQVRETALP